MNAFASSPTIHRLGWVLIHSTWQAIAIAVLLAVCLRRMRRKSAVARYAAAYSALVATVVASAATFVVIGTTPQKSEVSATVVAGKTPEVVPTRGAESVVEKSLRRSDPDAPTPAGPEVFVAPAARVDGVASESTRSAPISAGIKTSSFPQRASAWISGSLPAVVMVWSLGVCVLGFWNIGGWFAIQRLKSRQTSAVSVIVREAADAIGRRIGLLRAFDLLQSGAVDSPLVIGALKPIILLPAALLNELPLAQIESILAHELAHIRRHDYLANLLQCAIETLLFYHPAVWWISRQVRAERENCCDDLAISVTQDPAVYVEALVAVAATQAPAMALAAATGPLLPRVRRVLGMPDADAGSPRWLAGVVALTLIMGAGSCFLGSRPATLEVKLEPGHTIGGILKDDDGRPIEGALVAGESYLTGEYDPPLSQSDSLNSSVRTDAQGRWKIDDAPNDLSHSSLRVSHPDFTSADIAAGRNRSALMNRSFSLILTRGNSLSGRVLDDKGKPIANATITLEARLLRERPSATTDGQGRYTFAHVPNLGAVLIARASGFAPAMREVDVKAENAPVDFGLVAAHVFAGEVVDTKGNAVEGARLVARKMGAFGQVDFIRASTDRTGRFQLDGPNEPLAVVINHDDFMTATRPQFSPADGPIRITLLRPLKVTGTVTDAVTGDPIQKFQVTPGSQSEQTPILQTRMTLPAFDGRFSIDMHYVPGSPKIIRIEADGYLPVVSPPIVYETPEDEKPVIFDAKLIRGGGPTGIVLGLDAKPVAGAEVVLTTPLDQTMLTNGHVADRQNFSAVVKTGNDGRFTFKPTESKDFTLLVLHDAGFARVPRAAFERSAAITLQSWPRIEGTLKIGSKTAANEKVTVMLAGEISEDQSQPKIFSQYLATTDAAGRYALDRIFPGEGYVGRELVIDRGTTSTHAQAISQRFIAEAGKTLQITLGGTGRPVIGKVVLPTGISMLAGWSFDTGRLSTRVLRPLISYPENYATMSAADKSQWNEQWRKSDDGKKVIEAYQSTDKARKIFSFAVAADGTFRAEDVAPGTYELRIDVRAGQYGEKMIGSATAEVTIPDLSTGRSDEPLNAGTVTIHLRKTGEE